ncbi:conserved hypothetical protein [Magnetospirillum sp. UT-4]|nr:conserved hypothetical protein [Magnetospirillum sp. UT-4]
MGLCNDVQGVFWVQRGGSPRCLEDLAMNVVARQALSATFSLFADGFRPRQVWALLWSDVRSPSRRS